MKRAIVVRVVIGFVVGIAGCGKAKQDSPSAASACERGASLEIRVVDGEAPFIKALYARVKGEGGTADPAASAAGVTADVDQWQVHPTTSDGLPRGDKPRTEYYLRANDIATLERYVAAYQPPPADHEIRIGLVAGSADGPDAHYARTYYLAKPPILDGRAIATVQAGPMPGTSTPAITLELTPDGTQAFAKATADNLGSKVATLIDGTVESAPILESAITRGRLMVIQPTSAAADALAGRLGCLR